jgi:hypothetical protein
LITCAQRAISAVCSIASSMRTSSIQAAGRRWRDQIGGAWCSLQHDEGGGFATRQLWYRGGAKLELLEPADREGFAAGFLARFGARVHHVTLRVPDLLAAVDEIRAAGYDVALGDTWALNEFPSTVRRNLGTARNDARAFVSGLYEGDGRPVQGLVFVIGVMHGTNDATLYKSTLKSWFADAPFWLDMQRTVRFWGQEVYADARRWGVPGAAPDSGI